MLNALTLAATGLLALAAPAAVPAAPAAPAIPAAPRADRQRRADGGGDPGLPRLVDRPARLVRRGDAPTPGVRSSSSSAIAYTPHHSIELGAGESPARRTSPA